MWRWADGERVPLPSTSGWHVWYSGEPNSQRGSESCALLTNYKFWALRKVSFGSYFWVDFRCDYNGKQVQGYVCEREFNYRYIDSLDFYGLKYEVRPVKGGPDPWTWWLKYRTELSIGPT